MEEFDGFNDFMKTFNLLRGKKTEEEDDLERRFSGKFKVTMSVQLLRHFSKSVIFSVRLCVSEASNFATE